MSLSSHHTEAAPEQLQAQAMQAQLSPHELAYQESLVQEHEAEIREIETGIHELSEIFRHLGTLDNIESNVYSIAVDTAEPPRRRSNQPHQSISEKPTWGRLPWRHHCDCDFMAVLLLTTLIMV
ncbi:hypothetical protein F5888DRAFT_1158226 [Russula emetica]|nr:hypothetical protein F5888DRAFT_1158226 [Russula emetica]